jgi:hypothetical protein
MKLYTEEQVIDIFQKYGNMSVINARNIIDLSESIELPSDEEIEDASLEDNNDDLSPAEEFQQGAKWMRDKIGGNNEP